MPDPFPTGRDRANIRRGPTPRRPLNPTAAVDMPARYWVFHPGSWSRTNLSAQTRRRRWTASEAHCVPGESAAGGSEAREKILADTVGGLVGLAHDGDVLTAQRVSISPDLDRRVRKAACRGGAWNKRTSPESSGGAVLGGVVQRGRSEAVPDRPSRRLGRRPKHAPIVRTADRRRREPSKTGRSCCRRVADRPDPAAGRRRWWKSRSTEPTCGRGPSMQPGHSP